MQRKIVEIDRELCNGCGLCVKDCAENAIAIIDGKATVIQDQFCDGLGACIGTCPQGALKIIERDAAPFNAEAVLAQKEMAAKADSACIAAQVHWPLKLRLVPLSLKMSQDLLLCADCAAAASPHFHAFRDGRVQMIACPKFEIREAIVNRLAAILQNNPLSAIAVLRMEVPCCSGLATFAREACRQAGRDDAVHVHIMNRNGEIRNNPA